MTTAYGIVLVVHIALAASWLAAALWTPGDVRRTLALGQPHVAGLAARALPALKLDLWTGVGTVLSGLVLVGMLGGHPATGIQVGLAAALIRLALLVFGLLPAWRKIGDAIAAGDLTPAQGPARRMAMFSGIGHTLWIIALIGMVFD